MVDALIDAGYDVWLENWRASIDCPPNRWTLDQAALYDHPAAVKRVVAETGYDKIKVLAHCQGSVSFMMGAVAGLMPQVTTIVSNAVSLHPVVPRFAQIKQYFGVGLCQHLSDYMNPQWAVTAPTVFAKVMDAIVRLTHHECDNPVCKHISFTYGAGFPTLWSHDNLTTETHEWLKQEFAFCSMAFFVQMRRSIRAGHIVAVDGKPELPADVLAQPPRTDARVAFFVGGSNKCFLPVGQVRSYEYFNSFRPNYHSLHIVPNYGHLDMFVGKNAAEDVFPQFVKELDKPA